MNWDDARNILCIRLDQLGDVLMTTPALRALKESRPGRHITLLTSSSGAAIARLVPEIDDILVYDAPWLKATAPRESSRAEYEWAYRLRRQRFDAAVIFTVYSQNPLPAAFLCYLADIPRRLAHCHENPYQLLTHWVPDPEPAKLIRHEVRRQLDLVATIGARTEDERMSLQVSEAAQQRINAMLDALHYEPEALATVSPRRYPSLTLPARHRPLVAIHPGATAPSRRYPAAGFAEAASRLVSEVSCRVLFTGSPEESDLVESIRQGVDAPSESLAGRLSLEELAALLKRVDLLIANNTGPVHMAAALGTPVVDLYALTNPQHTPWLVPHRVLSHDVPCKYCYKSICPEGHHDCLRRVQPAAIVQAAEELLACGRTAGVSRLV